MLRLLRNGKDILGGFLGVESSNKDGRLMYLR